MKLEANVSKSISVAQERRFVGDLSLLAGAHSSYCDHRSIALQ